METLNNNKATVITAIIVAVITFALTSFFGSWNKLNDTLTQEQVTEQIEKSSESVLERSRRYTDDKVEAMRGTYTISIDHIEKLLDESNKRFEVLVESINDRLDRIDNRLNEK